VRSSEESGTHANEPRRKPVEGYCLKCREKREMQDPQEVTLKNGREAMQGTCAVCGTKITVMGGKKAAEKIAASDKSDNIPGKSEGAKAKGGASKAKAASK
jgi:hypothetical protein